MHSVTFSHMAGMEILGCGEHEVKKRTMQENIESAQTAATQEKGNLHKNRQTRGNLIVTEY
jgi:hypothetical protein